MFLQFYKGFMNLIQENGHIHKVGNMLNKSEHYVAYIFMFDYLSL
jgi:hypothetical protein